ncbi:MAG: hypothetical protein WBD40_07935 [Tepidisphaeraceae bacterium]
MNALRTIIAVAVVLFGLVHGTARADDAADQAYVKAFEEKFPRVASPPALAEYATPQRYDDLYLGGKLDGALKGLNNQRGAMAWGLSYRMVSLNEMARATGDAKYLAANLRCIQAALAVRDDRTGLKLYDGRVAAAWSSDGYRKGEQALFMVHTGMIVYPMLDAVHVARTMPTVPEPLLRDLEQTIAPALESLAIHDDAWRDGPGEGEAHYIMLGEEASSEGKPQPGNRLSGMGRALYAAYRVTKDEKYLNRSRALAQYIKRRLGVTEDGAYVWPYWLPLHPVTTTQPAPQSAEDTSHGSLTMSFPTLLAADSEVFTRDDIARFGKTVEHGIARLDNGVLFCDVGGSTKLRPTHLGHPANWLQLAPYAPVVRDRIVLFYLRYKPTPGPSELAYLIRFGAENK